jgi:pimeloyl-ACP methyl ester carboxylesterase
MSDKILSAEKRSQLRRSLIHHLGGSVQEAVVSAGGIKTSYLTAGSGFPVVMLHGGGGGSNALNWGAVMPILGRHFHVIAPDIAGHGESDKPKTSYSKAFFSKWLHDFSIALQLSHFTLVGSSMGGAIAIQYTLDHPESINRLVLVNAAGLGKLMGGLAFWTTMLRWTFMPSPASWRMMEKHLFSGQTLPGFDVGIYQEAVNYATEITRDPESRHPFYGRINQTIQPFQSEQLRQLAPPTFLLWGDADHTLPLSQAEQAREIIPNAQLKILSGVGHFPYIEQPEDFTQILLSYLLN